MSTERMAADLANDNRVAHLEGIKKVKKPDTLRVDINTLMDRVRAEKKKEKKENRIFLSLIASVILFTGVIASL